MQDKRTVAVTAIWYERYLECSRTAMTDVFYYSVMRLYHSLLDLDDGERAIRSKVDRYYTGVWRPLVDRIVNENTRDTVDESIHEEEERIVLGQQAHLLFRYIIQVIQDSGVGFQLSDDMYNYLLSQK